MHGDNSLHQKSGRTMKKYSISPYHLDYLNIKHDLEGWSMVWSGRGDPIMKSRFDDLPLKLTATILEILESQTKKRKKSKENIEIIEPIEEKKFHR